MSSADDDKVPTSTSETQIFPIGCCSSNFNVGDYDPEFADGKVTHKEITQAINDIQLARKPTVRKLLLLGFLMGWIYLITFFVVVFFAYVFFGDTKTGTIVGTISGLIGFGIINEIYDKRIAEITKESKDICYKMLDEKYKAAFEAKGLRWFLPTHFPRWVELQKIHGNGSQNTEQPIYIPPNQHQQLDANDMNAQV